jgi:glycosyltransferase involved in cell wall biosynthesis
LSIAPDLVDIAAGILGLKLRANFLLIILTIVTLSFIFIQFNANDRLKRELNLLAQELGIQRLYARSSLLNTSGDKRSSVLVKMAAFNEERNIRDVLLRMPPDVDVLVVDDGSTDSTGKIAHECGAIVVRHEFNMGQGIGDLTGFRIALELGYDVIVEMDADGQHDPAKIREFLDHLEANPDLDIVVGSRTTAGAAKGMDRVRRNFLPLYTRVINWASGYALTDAMCGYKAYRVASLLKHPEILREMLETEYIAAEMYIRFGSAGLKVGEIPIEGLSRRHGKSHKGTFRYGFAVAWVIIRSLLRVR